MLRIQLNLHGINTQNHFLCSHHKVTKQVTVRAQWVYKMIRSPLYYCRRSIKIYRILGFPLQPTDESFFQLKYNKHLEVFKVVSIQLLAAFFNYSVLISAVFDVGFAAYFCSDGMRKTFGMSMIDGVLFFSLCWILSLRNIAVVVQVGSRAEQISELNCLLAGIDQKLSVFMLDQERADLKKKRSKLPFNNPWIIAGMWIANLGSVACASYAYYTIFIIEVGALSKPSWMKFLWLAIMNVFTIFICVWKFATN